MNNSVDYKALTDEKLVVLCENKNPEAFREIMGRYLQPIYNFIVHYTKDKDTAEDVVQETFFKIWKYAEKFRKGNRFKPWIYTIAKNTLFDHFKKRKDLPFSNLEEEKQAEETVDSSIDQELSMMEMVESKDFSRIAKDYVEDLRSEYKIVLSLHYEQELTFEEIAEILNRPMNTVKNWHHRAISELKKLMGAPKP